MNENDIQNLNEWLDGELDAPLAHDLRRRLAEDEELAGELASVRQERAVREACFAACEPSEARADAVMAKIHDKIIARRRTEWHMRIVRMTGAVAACVAIGIGVGWIGRGGFPGHVPGSTATPVYQVNFADESGRVIGVQNFNSPDKAREFYDDLRRYDDQQEQWRRGYRVVRTGNF